MHMEFGASDNRRYKAADIIAVVEDTAKEVIITLCKTGFRKLPADVCPMAPVTSNRAIIQRE